MTEVPYGYCHCGCGEKTNLAPHSNARIGLVKGEPRRFVAGHTSRKTSAEYVVDPETGCWLWQRAITPNGYAQQYDREAKRVRPAHCVYYERHIGPIPAGYHIDHVRARGCRHRHCVNPAHLEPVTPAENARRGDRSKLTTGDVMMIRASTESANSLALRLGVSSAAVSAVRKGQAWADTMPSMAPMGHLTMPC